MTASPLILLILILILVAVFAKQGSFSRRSLLRADHYHWIIRSFAAVLALAAVVTTAVGTWRGAEPDPIAAEINVLVPTRPPQPLPEAPRGGAIEAGPAKWIGTVILVRIEGELLVPLAGESVAIEWAGDSLGEMTFSGSWPVGEYTVDIAMTGLKNFGGEPWLEGHLSRRFTGLGWSSSSGGGRLPIETIHFSEVSPSRSPARHSALSLVPLVKAETMGLVIHLTRADLTDPLVGVAADDWLEGQTIDPSDLEREPRSHSSVNQDAPPGIRMMAYVGPAGFLLLLGAAAGSLCFRHGRRGPAFAGLLLVMVLHAGVLDAVVLQRHANVMNDPGQPEWRRERAMDAMRGTFFHPGRAERLIAESAEG